MRRLAGRLPPPEGGRWVQEEVDSLVGTTSTLTVGPWALTGKVVEVKVVEDEWLGHGLWVVVESEEE